MKIVQLATDNREHLKDYGNPVPFFGTAPAALFQGFAQLPDVEVHIVSCTRVRMTSPEKIAPNIYFHSLLVPKRGWMTTLYQGTIRATRAKLREIQPDIVHGQGTERDCAINAVCSGFKNVLTIHGNMRLIAKVNQAKPFSFLWLAARLERRIIPRSLGVVCITHYTQRAVSDLAKRTWVVPNGVEESFFGVQAEPPPGQPPQVLCVGNVCLRKNQNAFIRALDPLAQKRKFRVLFLGETSRGRAYDDEFLQLVRERPGWCSYGGTADRQKLREHFRESSALALPSLEDNCPMVVLEAMASGVPVVAANVGGVPDLVQDARTGLFCDPLDAGSIAGALEKVLANTSASREMAARARQEALERFHPKAIARRHVEIYREVIGRRA
jgi:glycosyltransferase involved in cell wall biosynthesis